MSQLDVAVDRNSVALLKGLPRVGRSSFLVDWKERRSDAIFCEQVQDVRVEPGIFILDHVEGRDIDQIVHIVRAAEQARIRTRLVVAPSNLTTADRLLTALPGVVTSIEIPPLRIEDIGVEIPRQLSAGPVDAPPLASGPSPGDGIDLNRHWLRGGLPASLTASNDLDSMLWRLEMLEGLLARDYTAWRIERAFRMVDMFRWLANQNSGELDENGCGFAKRQELSSAVHVFELLGLVRRLPNYPVGSTKSLGKKSKLFVRDTGLLHAVLGIETMTQLRASNAIGGSFESYATEALILATEGRAGAQFYREKGSDGDDEIDLILNFPSQDGRLVAIEFKVGPAQTTKKGFVNVCTALNITDRFVVHSGDVADLNGQVHRLDLKSAVTRIAEISGTA